MKRWLENRSGLCWGTYRWRGAPLVFLAIGPSSKATTWLEAGIAGRQAYLAPLRRPRSER